MLKKENAFNEFKYYICKLIDLMSQSAFRMPQIFKQLKMQAKKRRTFSPFIEYHISQRKRIYMYVFRFTEYTNTLYRLRMQLPCMA